MKKEKTGRGFSFYKFKDGSGTKCSIQKSSVATEDMIWIGVSDPDPKIMASQASQFGIKTDKNNGWIKYPIPDEVIIKTRMHLNRKQALNLIRVLLRFIIRGEI